VAADSKYIFDYLNDVWDLLPDQDQDRFGALWKAYEQTYGSVWMQQFDSDLGNTIQNLPLYNILRWIQHPFDSTTQVLLSASYTSPIDFSGTTDLADRYLIKLSVDGGTPVELDLRGLTPGATTLAEVVARINSLLGQKIVSPTNSNQLLKFTSTTSGPGSSLTFYPTSNPARDASAIVLGLDPVANLPATYPKFPYAYQLADTRVVGIPVLQDAIQDALITTLIAQNTDYTVQFGTGIISFAVQPPAAMWAKDTLINYETPYNNFGYLMGIYDSNTPNYLKIVKGLWFAFWNGPSPENIKRSLYLLFGLPTASLPGTVTSVSPTTIVLTYTDASTETFSIPVGLTALVSQGQTLTQFQPLITGINVYDKVNYPGFLRKELGRPAVQPFLTQFATRGSGPDTDETKALTILEENTYLPQINVYAFISPSINLANVFTFLKEIQPKSRSFLYQILVGLFQDQLPLYDEGLTTVPTDQYPNGLPSLGLTISFDTTPNVDWNGNTMGDLDTWTEAEDNPYTELILDDDVILFGDFGTVNVYQSAVLIDSFSIEG
jgi:hypothetical protein